jgi:bifunctional UDP-N-acetylglucosamine pyrophosphorylase/glucosamine-1-phosphate N-acetyltransferase
MLDPERTYIEESVELAPDVVLLPGVVLEGRTVVSEGCTIGPDCRIADSVIGPDVTIEYSVIRESEVCEGASVGPYAHLRGGTRIGPRAKVGDFVEMKNTDFGEGAKAYHLAYLGDATVGPRANIGAGTITANYDGKDKHRSAIGERARTGSNSVLVAPINVGDGAVIGAGSVVTHDVDSDSLVRGVPARPVKDWVDPARSREDRGPDAEGSPEGAA